MTGREMETRYDHTKEGEIYAQWEKSGYFNPDECIKNGITQADAKPFSLVLPPPNVTGTLHIGHAFEDTIQDVVIRYERMRGKRTLWIPGTDHAAIATQSKVEKILEKEGKKKYDFSREEFIERVNRFAKESHDVIVRQIRRLGASLDWSREAYTLDEKRSLSVRTAFKKMYDLGLIDRGFRVVNWDPKGQTTISDDEVVYEERKAKLYTFRYDKKFPIAISTTRPETKFGDTAVAVHPSDERYKKFIGQEYDPVFCGVPLHIKVIADESVEKDFGTGALGVTPAHSMIDWKISRRHGLLLRQVIDERGRMMVGGEAIEGKKTAEAREAVVEELRRAGLLEKEEEVIQNLATAERSGGIIEPLPKLQWFVLVNKKFRIDIGEFKGQEKTLKELMRESVSSGRIKIVPERFEKIYFNWIDNLDDWCISRQIWFGHRIPVWYKGDIKPASLLSQSNISRDGKDIYVGIEPPEGDGWTRDPDTLDTWFSSALWPFSTLGWPEETDDLRIYFPNSFMGPGYEILFFWVARMILMSECLLGEVPFRVVYLHGIVRDSKGQKFSKSLGNGIDPLELADKYGADALRMALVAGAAPGNDVKFDEQRVRGYRNFSTKIWNIARFITLNHVNSEKSGLETDFHKRCLDEFEALKIGVTKDLEEYNFHLASEKIYHYIWHSFADRIVEAEKENFRDGDETIKAESSAFLENLFSRSLKMLHPFMPFVTEAVWSRLPGKKNMLMVERW